MTRPRQRRKYTFQHEVLSDDGGFHQVQHEHAAQTEQDAQEVENGSASDQGGYEEDFSFESVQGSLSWNFGSRENCILLSISQDRREAHFLTPQYELDTMSIEPLQYGFLGLRFVKLAAEETQLVSFCRNPSCPDAADDGTLYERADFASCPAATLFSNHKTLCTCAEALLKAVGGEAGLKRELAGATVPELEAELQPVLHESRGHSFSVVRAGESFSDWALVKGTACQTCPSQRTKCRHVLRCLGVPQRDAEPAEWLSSEAYERKIEQCLDSSTGRFRLTCISRQQIPEEPEDDDLILAIIRDRSSGRLTVSSVCAPDATTSCPLCGQCDWQPSGVPADTCTVFLLAAAVAASFPTLQCGTAQCTGQLSADGREHAVLRQSAKHAFGYELLYDWADKTAVGGAPWFTFWRDVLQRYAGESVDTLRHWMGLRSVFQSATLNFIELQGLDYDFGAGGFSCGHESGVTADGITLGYHLEQAHLEAPYLPTEASSLCAGSTFSERIFVRSKKMRELMHRFSSAVGRGGGISAGEYEGLMQELEEMPADRPEATLLPFMAAEELEGDRRCFCKAVRPFLHILSTSAPACQLMKPTVFGVMEAVINGQLGSLSVDDLRPLSARCPHLYGFIKPYLGLATVPEHVTALLQAVLKVARQAFDQAEPVVWQSVPSRQSGDQLRTNANLRRASRIAASTSNPLTWTRSESFLRTGCWSGLGPSNWQPTSHGGSDVYRPMRSYAADSRSFGSVPTCTKHQRQTKKLVPGCQFFWCLECRKCILFVVMGDAESPRTLFEALYTRFPSAPPRFCFDNGCNVHNYILNREPQHFRDMEVYVDETHWHGHNQCSVCYNTGEYKDFENSPLAEEKNRFLAMARTQCAYMQQITFLRYVRFFLYRLNKLEALTSAGKCWWRRPSKIKGLNF